MPARVGDLHRGALRPIQLLRYIDPDVVTGLAAGVLEGTGGDFEFEQPVVKDEYMT